MKATPKLIVFHPSLYKHGVGGGGPHSHRLWILALFSLFTFTLLCSLLKHSPPPPPLSTVGSHLPTTISDALLHYAAASNSTTGDMMTSGELSAVSSALRHCSPDCNFLIFGLTHETLLWRALNHGSGRTVFLDENEYLISKFEHNFTNFEGYDVQYTTKVGKSKELISYAREHRKGECRPVQNLLFSDCKLAINDLPNHLYEINWDLILIDGPRGYSTAMPGRMSAIFTAAVMGRSKREKGGERKPTHVFVHDFGREVERVFSEEFLCVENLVEERDSLAHFVVEPAEAGRIEFCTGKIKGKISRSSS